MVENELLNAVKIAMEKRELKPYYQPQYDSITNKLSSAEALVRWIKEDGSVVLPGDYLPLLEKTEMICDLDWYMLDSVCQFIKRLMKEKVRVVPIAVNFSRKHVDEDSFVDRLCNIVDSYEVPHKLIEVEITETAYVENPKRMIKWIEDVRSKKFTIAIDDFGSGLSSISFVTNVTADVLKIDKSLIDQNCESEKERIILESIFDFSHRLNIKTVAEGVETKEQLSFLRTCDCKLIQGFLFAKPMPEDDFYEICKNDNSEEYAEDILVAQAPASARSLLMEAIFMRYPLVIMANITRNSYYMMVYDNFTSKSCPSTGVFSELIEHGTTTMHPEDQDLFHDTFMPDNLMKLYNQGEKVVSIVTRQIGDDGQYRRVETTDYFVKNPSVDDVLVVTLCQNLD